jgi:hypothetical protein
MPSITGGWALRVKQPPAFALQEQPDPEHMTPTDNPEYVHTTPQWQATTHMPGLPDELLASPNPELAIGIGPVDQTPESHDYGVGVGPGLTTLESQDKMLPWHSDDQWGHVAAESWVHATDRDGSWNLAEILDERTPGDSPETVRLKAQGVGEAANDPEAQTRRAPSRYKRWVDRYIDMHRYDSVPGPVKPQYAVPNPPRGPHTEADQLVPPYGNSVAFLAGPQDRFVGQNVRRAPDDWAANLATDGSGSDVTGSIDSYGLPSWGL